MTNPIPETTPQTKKPLFKKPVFIASMTLLVLILGGLGVQVYDFMDGYYDLQKTVKTCQGISFYNYPTIKGTTDIYPNDRGGKDIRSVVSFTNKDEKKELVLTNSSLKTDTNLIKGLKECYSDYKVFNAIEDPGRPFVEPMDTSSTINSTSTQTSSKSTATNPTGTQFSDPELPIFKLNYPAGWELKAEKFMEGNGSGAPGRTFYSKRIDISKGSAQLSIVINSSGPSGIGLTSCYEKSLNMIKGSKYTIIENSIELSKNLSYSGDADFDKYFNAGAALVVNNNAKSSDYAACVKSSRLMNKTPSSFKDSTGKAYTDGYVSIMIFGGSQSEPVELSGTQLKEIGTILDTITGDTQVEI